MLFFFNDTATTEIYTLSLHDALPIFMPSVSYAFNEHHLDFPGTISVRGETFIQYVSDIGRSLAHHGFRKILLVNGHGSNRSEEHTSELQSRQYLVCRLLLEKKKKI